jgi:hypothetical protein
MVAKARRPGESSSHREEHAEREVDGVARQAQGTGSLDYEEKRVGEIDSQRYRKPCDKHENVGQRRNEEQVREQQDQNQKISKDSKSRPRANWACQTPARI